jgi:hypothetical protein
MPDAPPAVLRSVPVPSAALLARLAPLTPVPGRPDLVAHQAPDPVALWQAWEAECGAIQGVPFWAVVWPASRTATGCRPAPSCLPRAAAPGHSRRSAPAWWGPDSASVYSRAGDEGPNGRRARPFVGLATWAAAV